MPDHDTGARRLRVLIVEDEFLIADYLAMLVEDAGHVVTGIVGTAEDALAALAASHVDVVSLDVKLPGAMDGVGLATLLRTRGGPPFLFVTGSGDPEFRARCEAAEPIAILQKPVDPAALLAALARTPGRG